MSILGSREDIGWEEGGSELGADGEWREVPGQWGENGRVLSYCDGWSNHYPNEDSGVELPATICLAEIPSWCVPGHRDSEDHGVLGPWVRLDVDSPRAVTVWSPGSIHQPQPNPQHVSVILDEQAAKALRDQIDEWLDARKVFPREERG